MKSVSPLRAGLGAAVLAAVFVLATFVVAPLPGAALAVVGGEPDGIGRYGGVVVSWAPPPGVDANAIATAYEGARVVGDALEIPIVGVPPEGADRAVKLLAGGAVRFHRVVQTDAMVRLVQDHGVPLLKGPGRAASEVGAVIDQWMGVSGEEKIDYFLVGPSIEAIEAAVAAARLHGWSLHDGDMLAYERVLPVREDSGSAPFYRSYVLEAAPGLVGHVADAEVVRDPYSNRPQVLLSFDAEGTAVFGDLSASMVDRKLATVLGGEVVSAPVITGAIRGGRAAISLASSDPASLESEAETMAAFLRGGALPDGGTVRSQRYVVPSAGSWAVWAARGVLAGGAALLVGLLTWLLVRITRPGYQVRPVMPGRVPLRRVTVTLLAPLVVVLVTSVISMPGIDSVEIEHITRTTSYSNLGMFGLAPLLTGFLVVELVATLVPRWRKRRHAELAVRFEVASIVLAILLTAAHAGFRARSLERAGLPVDALIFVSSAAAMTAVYAALAGFIRASGLGNGYLVIAASSIGWSIVEPLIFGVDMLGPDVSTAQLAAALVTLGVFALGTAVVVRWRVMSAKEAALQVPTPGLGTVSDLQSMLVLVMLAVGGLLPALGSLGFGLAELQAWAHDLNPAVAVLIAVIFAVLLSWAFARPAVTSEYAERASLSPPSWRSWTMVTVLSTGIVAIVVAGHLLVSSVQEGLFGGVASGLILGAVALDLVVDARGRRGALVRVWTLRSAQHVPIAEHVLADADIPCHLSGAGGRALLAWFGPFVPVDVHVAPEHAVRARERLAMVFAPKL